MIASVGFAIANSYPHSIVYIKGNAQSRSPLNNESLTEEPSMLVLRASFHDSMIPLCASFSASAMCEPALRGGSRVTTTALATVCGDIPRLCPDN
jgi:hypothetical protein